MAIFTFCKYYDKTATTELLLFLLLLLLLSLFML